LDERLRLRIATGGPAKTLGDRCRTRAACDDSLFTCLATVARSAPEHTTTIVRVSPSFLWRPLELVDSFVELGTYFSSSGYFLNENKKAKLVPFHEIPMDRLLVETDAPAMPLPPERNEFSLPRREDGGSPNHPANIRAIYRGVAQIRQLSEQEPLDAVRRNFDRLFQSAIDS
jgi:TatD related DNase